MSSEMRICTCVGTCRGGKGLVDGWQCALELPVLTLPESTPPSPPQPGDTVLVEAVVKQHAGADGERVCIVEIDGYQAWHGVGNQLVVKASAIHPAPAKPAVIKCARCHGDGKVIDPESLSSTSMWTMPCPQCQPAKKGEAS